MEEADSVGITDLHHLYDIVCESKITTDTRIYSKRSKYNKDFTEVLNMNNDIITEQREIDHIVRNDTVCEHGSVCVY